MSDPTIIVHTPCRAILPHSAGGLTATFTYDPTRPFDVALTIGEAHYRVTWLVSRDILGAGLLGPAGLADVQAYPLGPDLAVALDGVSHDDDLPASATFVMPATVVAAFLERTATLVPYGREGDHLDLDRELAELLG